MIVSYWQFYSTDICQILRYLTHQAITTFKLKIAVWGALIYNLIRASSFSSPLQTFGTYTLNFSDHTSATISFFKAPWMFGMHYRNLILQSRLLQELLKYLCSIICTSKNLLEDLSVTHRRNVGSLCLTSHSINHTYSPFLSSELSFMQYSNRRCRLYRAHRAHKRSRLFSSSNIICTFCWWLL